MHSTERPSGSAGGELNELSRSGQAQFFRHVFAQDVPRLPALLIYPPSCSVTCVQAPLP